MNHITYIAQPIVYSLASNGKSNISIFFAHNWANFQDESEVIWHPIHENRDSKNVFLV